MWFALKARAARKKTAPGNCNWWRMKNMCRRRTIRSRNWKQFLRVPACVRKGDEIEIHRAAERRETKAALGVCHVIIAKSKGVFGECASAGRDFARGALIAVNYGSLVIIVVCVQRKTTLCQPPFSSFPLFFPIEFHWKEDHTNFAINVCIPLK